MSCKQRRSAAKLGQTRAKPHAGTAVDANSATGELLLAAWKHHNAGRSDEAKRHCRQILAVDPRHADALHLLGVVAGQTRRLELAVEMIDKAIALNSEVAVFHCNLGLVLNAQGKLADSVMSYERALTLRPDYAEAHYNLGNAFQRLGKLARSVASYERATVLKPGYGMAHYGLGNALYGLEKFAGAVVSYERGLALMPGHAEAHSNLGNALTKQGKLADAVVAYHRALALKPDYATAHNNLGNAFKDQGKLAEAVASYERALALKPDYAEAHNNLGTALRSQGKLADAVASYERALAFRPDYGVAHYNLANVLYDQGKFSEAIVKYERALALKQDYAEAHYNIGNALARQDKPADAVLSYERALALRCDYANAHQSLLFNLHYIAEFSSADMLERAQRFSRQCQGHFTAPEFVNRPILERRLRIGYVSGDFGDHPVGYFLANVLPAHDRVAVEVFCYSNSLVEDTITEHLRRSADHWRSIVEIPDSDAALIIQRDSIDILVDLSGHTAKNRLLLFARRPAPVQLTWLGYFGTTGLTTIDYILADRFVVLKGEESNFTETVWRLPESYLCFAPPDLDIPALTPPATRGNPITFGSFNNNAKTSPNTIALWSRVLLAASGSRLLLKTKSLADESAQQRLLDQFADHGISSDRLLFEGQSPRAEMLAIYNRVDIALDPTPYGGGTTTAEALWMGVPVVTLRGERWAGRITESIVSAIGLSEFIATTPDEYVEISFRLATDLPRLTKLRSDLRPQMQSSAFCDGTRFTRFLEGAYRGMWQRWCINQ